MKIAYTMAPGRGDTDQLLFTLAQDLAAEGYRTCGTVQINTDRGGHPCDMDVQVLPDGPVLRISQNLGAEAKGWIPRYWKPLLDWSRCSSRPLPSF